MRILELQPGQFMTRDNWGNRGSQGHLCIGRHADGSLHYYDHGNRSSPVRQGSTAYSHTDFRLCQIDAQPLPKEKENPMPQYQDIQIVVTSTTNQTPQAFATEDEALDWIAEKLENSPRTKFTMFKPYQKIEPKRPSLVDLIVKITS